MPLTLPLTSYLSDPNGDPLTVVPDLTAAPWLSYDPATGVLTGTPPADNTGPITVPVTVSDGKGGVTIVNVVISPTNPAPTAVTDSYAATEGGPAIALAPLTADSDSNCTNSGRPSSVPPAQPTAPRNRVATPATTASDVRPSVRAW